VTATVPGFEPGDQVWPTEGPFILQHAPQVIIATYRHPELGDWLWLDDGHGGLPTFAAKYWTTTEPDPAEQQARAARVQRRIAENEAQYADAPWRNWPIV
jgi:hypothetical protein